MTTRTISAHKPACDGIPVPDIARSYNVSHNNISTADGTSSPCCMTKLTPKQRRLQREIEEISELIGMDHWNISQYDKEARTAKLGVIKMQIVRGEIITKYTQ
jgi:hypothetical protein